MTLASDTKSIKTARFALACTMEHMKTELATQQESIDTIEAYLTTCVDSGSISLQDSQHIFTELAIIAKSKEDLIYLSGNKEY